MFDKILLALDMGGLAESAIPSLVGIAGPSASVLVLAVRDVYTDQEPPEATAARVDAVVRRLAAAGLRAKGEVRSTYRRPPAGEIVTAVAEYRPELVAMGSHGRSELGGLFLGSVSHQVAAKVDCPVLVVHGEPRPGTSQKPARIRRILVAVDKSEQSRAGVQAARGLAANLGGSVQVVHALETIVGGEAATYLEDEAEGKAVLEEAVRQLQGSGGGVRSRLLYGPEPVATRIAAAADEWQADVIILGSRRLTGLGGLLLGSVAHGVVRCTQRPVLLAERAGVTAGAAQR